MTLTSNHKLVLIASLVSAVYFGLLFSNLLQYVNSVLVRVAVEMSAIPMVILQGVIIVYTLRWIFIQKNKVTIQILIPLIISITLVVSMFLVK
ncbi:hypothetical protein [Pedobacter nyackensis]|uniref:Branched-chain amino acid:cation transporter, LIVCS family n=1 Tax=Pedobacter nyackensis TaxID=475255 RepID=A0A1W2AH98_9SPHI|nr:hypothetical protein [Pedobacter nyackensis]SMC59638.1 hypothetical protein SAMN04488101_101576 [Pedobacter nyackensis]